MGVQGVTRLAPPVIRDCWPSRSHDAILTAGPASAPHPIRLISRSAPAEAATVPGSLRNQAVGHQMSGHCRERSRVVDLKLEVVVLPVADVDRAKAFYLQLGWRLDADATAGDSFRIVQLTPPGSQCSIQFGTNMTSAAPGSVQDLYLIVADIEAVRDQLIARGAAVSEVFHEGTLGDRFQPPGAGQRAGARARQLRLVRLIQRSGRQHLAAAGDQHAAAWPGRGRPDSIRVRGGPGGGR